MWVGVIDGTCVAAQVWRWPTARQLPSDGTWLELSRWCLTPEGGKNLGSRQHGRFVRWLRAHDPAVTTLVSYSDPSVGHTGALYRACNWIWAPTHHRLRLELGDGGYSSKHGAWSQHDEAEEVKDRWVFPVRHDPLWVETLRTPVHPALLATAEAAGLCVVDGWAWPRHPSTRRATRLSSPP